MALDTYLSVAILLVSTAVVRAAVIPSTTSSTNLPSQRPLVIAHRGSSGVLPEHTIEAYQRAVSDGADAIECDVTLSLDLVPVCLHDNYLQTTTDVADRPEFANRNRTITVNATNGQQITQTGWFAIDFTLAELKTLRRRQSHTYRDHSFDGRYTIPTLLEHIDVAKSASRPVAIYPEIKDPELLNGLDLLRNSSQRVEDIVLNVLENNGYRNADDLCYIQSFSEESLLYVSDRTKLRLVMLTEDRPSDDRLAQWARSFYGVGAWVNVVAPHWKEDNGYKNWIGNNATDFVSQAHANGLKVHVWTLRNEERYLAWDFAQNVDRAFDFYMAQQVDGMFTDFPQSLSSYLDLVYSCVVSAGRQTTEAAHWRSTIVLAGSLTVIIHLLGGR